MEGKDPKKELLERLDVETCTERGGYITDNYLRYASDNYVDPQSEMIRVEHFFNAVEAYMFDILGSHPLVSVDVIVGRNKMLSSTVVVCDDYYVLYKKTFSSHDLIFKSRKELSEHMFAVLKELLKGVSERGVNNDSEENS